jgi:small subunit ribosomal protein S2
MKDVTLADLLKAGAHFGHKSSRWNPKMKPFIYGHRNNIHIFDLEKTRTKLLDALQFARDIAATGGTIMFVGTKKQAKAAVKEAAESCGMPYVTERWLGGTFTNFRTVQRSMKKLERLVALKDSSDIEAYTKKERLLMDREITKLNRLFSGMASVKSLPQAIFVFSSEHDQIAIQEAKRMKLSVIAVVDTNSDPASIDYVIPANDDSVQAISLYASMMAAAINEGKKAAPAAVIPLNKTEAAPAPSEKAAA